jgi:phosphatidylglycerol:prolipoprotein diacylglycerol transferase
LLDPFGGVAVAFVSGVIYVNRKQILVWPTLDGLTPFLSVMWIAIGLSNLASGKAFGMETQVPWGIDLWGAQRHPTQIYQVMAGFIILGFIWPRERVTASASLLSGETFWRFSALSATALMVVEAFKGDSSLLPGGLRIAQILAWFALSISLWGLGWIRKKSTNSNVPV